MTALLSRRNETKTDDVQQQTASMQCFNHQDASAYAKGSGETGRTPRFQPQMNTDFPSAACAATTDFGLRREAKRHAAFERNRPYGKRCRRCALPPQLKSLSSVREVAGLYYGLKANRIERAPRPGPLPVWRGEGDNRRSRESIPSPRPSGERVTRSGR